MATKLKPVVLSGKKLTASNVLREIERCIKNVKPGDAIWVHCEGPGCTVPATKAAKPKQRRR